MAISSRRADRAPDSPGSRGPDNGPTASQPRRQIGFCYSGGQLFFWGHWRTVSREIDSTMLSSTTSLANSCNVQRACPEGLGTARQRSDFGFLLIIEHLVS